jgi:hypothetical protein
MACNYSPTPIPEPVDPPLPPDAPDPLNPAPNPTARAAALAASCQRNLLRLTEHAFWVLVSHGVSLEGQLPLICAACQKPWRCPEFRWAADWILTAKRVGLLDEFALRLSDDVRAIVGAWAAASPVSSVAEAV